MKLIYAIVNGDDSSKVAKALTAKGFYATKLASTGSFLSKGNTTFLICTENEKVQTAIEIIKEKSRSRKQMIQSAPFSVGMDSGADFPVEVSVGGATVFVTDVEHFEKV